MVVPEFDASAVVDDLDDEDDEEADKKTAGGSAPDLGKVKGELESILAQLSDPAVVSKLAAYVTSARAVEDSAIPCRLIWVMSS